MLVKMQSFVAAILILISLAPGEAPWEPEEADIVALAQLLYGECRGCSELQQRAVCWCVFNRVDSDKFPDTVIGVITQRSQFFGYSPNNPVWDNLYELAKQCLIDWYNGENRVFSKDFLYFTGNGRINIFRTGYNSGAVWAEE